MEIVNASDAKREFGELLLKAQKQPVGIKRNGKAVAVVISSDAYEEHEVLKKAWLELELQKGLEEVETGNISSGPEVMKRLRNTLHD